MARTELARAQHANQADRHPSDATDEEWDLDSDSPPYGAANRINGLYRNYRGDSDEFIPLPDNR